MEQCVVSVDISKFGDLWTATGGEKNNDGSNLQVNSENSSSLIMSASEYLPQNRYVVTSQKAKWQGRLH